MILKDSQSCMRVQNKLRYGGETGILDIEELNDKTSKE